jgi:hypothetical protein
MATPRKSSVTIPMFFPGYKNSHAPPIPKRDSQEQQVKSDETGNTNQPTAQPPRPSPLSRESSYQSSSRPSSRRGTPKATRPRSQYPDGDFRNSSMADLVELKTDVMCNWLHQQQAEKMWSNNGRGEGVMLKKARDDYICCPKDLQAERDGLFDAVKKLNVKVSVLKIGYPSQLTSSVCNDRQYSDRQVLPSARRPRICPPRGWPATTDPIHGQPTSSMPETSLRSLHTRSSIINSLG